MSANVRQNIESHVAEGAEFHAKRPGGKPLTTKGHKPGVQASPYDKVPEFSAETHPPGTAPREQTYQPRPEGEIPGQQVNPKSETFTDAASTLGGTTSGAVHNATAYGKPVQGLEGRELEHDGGRKRKKEGTGLTGLASTGIDTVREKGADLPEGVSKGTRGKAHPDYSGAEDRVPESAERTAAEY